MSRRWFALGFLVIGAAAALVAGACTKFTGDDADGPMEAGDTSTTPPPDSEPPVDAPSPADAGAFRCATRKKVGQLFSFCQDFDDGKPYDDGWSLVDTSKTDVGIAPTIDPGDALSPPRAVFVRLQPTANEAVQYARLRKTFLVPVNAKHLEATFDVRFDALHALDADGYMTISHFYYPGVVCDAATRAREVGLTLFSTRALLAANGFHDECSTSDSDGVDFKPPKQTIPLAGPDWHHVTYTLDTDDACDPSDAGAKPGSIRIAFDDSTTCYSNAQPLPRGGSIDLNVGVSAARSPRMTETRVTFDNVTIDLD